MFFDTCFDCQRRQSGYTCIKANNQGSFQFGLVTGYLDGYLEQIGEQERFAFTWDGNDEMDEASGSGWIRLINEDKIEGMINFHHGDKSLFQATKE